MISTAVQLLEASKESLFNPMSLNMFKKVVEAKDENEGVFLKTLYDFASHLVAYNTSNIMDILMTTDEMSDFSATIDELDEMEQNLNGE